MGRVATRSPGRLLRMSRARSGGRSTVVSFSAAGWPPVDNCGVTAVGVPLSSAALGMAGGSVSDRRSGELSERWNLSAMPTNSVSERSGEAERSEGPQDRCCQVPLCPSSFLPSSVPFHGWSVSGSLEHQAKRLVPSGPVPLPLSRVAGVRVAQFLLVIAPFGRTAFSSAVATPYPWASLPREERSRQGVRVRSRCRRAAQRPRLGTSSQHAAAGVAVVAAQRSPLPRPCRSSCGQLRCRGTASGGRGNSLRRPFSHRRVVLAVLVLALAPVLRCAAGLPGRCLRRSVVVPALRARARGGCFSGLLEGHPGTRSSSGPCSMSRLRDVRGALSWAHQKKEIPRGPSRAARVQSSAVLCCPAACCVVLCCAPCRRHRVTGRHEVPGADVCRMDAVRGAVLRSRPLLLSLRTPVALPRWLCRCSGSRRLPRGRRTGRRHSAGPDSWG